MGSQWKTIFVRGNAALADRNPLFVYLLLVEQRYAEFSSLLMQMVKN